MKFSHFIALTLLIHLTACHKSDPKNLSPASAPEPQSQTLPTEANSVPRDTVFTQSEFIELENKAKGLGCAFTLQDGISNCTNPTSADDLHVLLSLLDQINVATRTDTILGKEYERQSMVSISSLKERFRLEGTSVGLEVRSKTDQLGFETYLNRGVIVDDTNIVQTMKAMELLKQLSENAEFGKLLVDKGIDLISLSLSTKVDSIISYRYLFIGYADTAETVMQSLRDAPTVMMKDDSELTRALNNFYFNFNFSLAHDLTEPDKLKGLIRLAEFKGDKVFLEEMSRLDVDTIELGMKTSIFQHFTTTELQINIHATKEEILAEIKKIP